MINPILERITAILQLSTCLDYDRCKDVSEAILKEVFGDHSSSCAMLKNDISIFKKGVEGHEVEKGFIISGLRVIASRYNVTAKYCLDLYYTKKYEL